MDSSNILIDILDEIEIDLILDDNNGSSINTNFEKIKNNIDIIKNLYYNNIYNNISNDISINFQNLRTLITSKKHNCDVNTTNYISYYKQIKQILGLIICNIYRNSDYHILMANIPDVVYTDTDTNTINYVNSEVIFDTVEKYIGLDTIVNVFQVSEHNYLVRFKSYDDSIKTCNMLNKMQIGENIIKVELLCKKPYSLKTEPEAKTEPEPDAKPNPEPEPDTKTELDAEPEPDAKIEDNIVESANIVESQYIVEDIKTANVEEYIKSVNIEAEIAEIAQKQKYSNILVVNIAYGIYNKVSNIVNYFRR